MNPRNVAMLVSLLETLKSRCEEVKDTGAEHVNPFEEMMERAEEAPIDRTKEARDDIPYFKRFPDNMHDVFRNILNPPTDQSEALMRACIWVAKQDERIEMLEKRGSTLEAKLAGQRDRMHTLEQTMQDINIRATDAHSRINSLNGRTGALEKLVIGDAKGEDECCDPAIPTPIGTKRSDNV